MNMKARYVSIMIDGTTRWNHHFLTIILYTRFDFAFYKTKIVNTEDTMNISILLDECIQILIKYNKIICYICSDNFSANKSGCKVDNSKYLIFRQYCNCHCTALAITFFHQTCIVSPDTYRKGQINFFDIIHLKRFALSYFYSINIII